jgi:flagellin-like protein
MPKAISPMIATVLLIAFTVAVGGILSLWLTGYMTTTTGVVETATTNQTKCVGTYINVISVDSGAILITNPGSQNISSIKCYSGNATYTAWSLGNLLPGEMGSTGWNGTGTTYNTSFGTSVTCTGTCLVTGVTGGCKSGQSCWKV